jgi:two-component system cell cycle sensor histidine kinase/response regulator CckA
VPERLEEQLDQAQKMEAIGRDTGGIAHDFNNLLLVISSYSAILLADPATGDLDAVHEIAKAADHGAVLTRQLLGSSRHEAPQPQLLDLNGVVLEVVPMLNGLLADNVEIVVRLAPKVDEVRADPGALERVLVNLVVNARDAMPDGGRLTIETANVRLEARDTMSHLEGKQGPNVMLALIDTGTGMSRDVHSRLFEPFFSTKDVGQGTGLGLASVFGVVKQTGGGIHVDTREGAGSTFKIYLPASTAARG